MTQLDSFVLCARLVGCCREDAWLRCVRSHARDRRERVCSAQCELRGWPQRRIETCDPGDSHAHPRSIGALFDHEPIANHVRRGQTQGPDAAAEGRSESAAHLVSRLRLSSAISSSVFVLSLVPLQMAWISDSSSPMRSMRVSAQGELVLAGESFEQGSVTDTNSKYETLEKVRAHTTLGAASESRLRVSQSLTQL